VRLRDGLTAHGIGIDNRGCDCDYYGCLGGVDLVFGDDGLGLGARTTEV